LDALEDDDDDDDNDDNDDPIDVAGYSTPSDQDTISKKTTIGRTTGTRNSRSLFAVSPRRNSSTNSSRIRRR